jgi:hypothetical protein
MLLDWYEITISALKDLYVGFVDFTPKLIGAIIIFLVGWIVSVAIGKLISEVLRKIKFNRLFERGDMKSALQKADFKVDAAGFIGALFKWILVIVFLAVAVEILGFQQFAAFLTEVLSYLPNVVVAALIFVVAVIIADLLEKVVRAAVESTKVGYGHITGIIVKWSIWIFAILAILFQLKIAPQLIQTLLTGVVALIVLAGGLAFGLGGKEVAAEILQDIKKKFKGQ